MVENVLLRLFIFLLLDQHCSAVTRKWLPNTNYGNPANWDQGRVPCSGDNVQLDKLDKPLAVSLRGSHTIKSLSLPVNGEMIFYDGAELHFSEAWDADSDASDTCKDSGDIHFVASVQEWYNPSNWQDITLPMSSNIILHVDNVPCVHDTVVFPQDSSFSVTSSIPVKVASVELFGEKQSSKSFKDFYSSPSGRLQFNLTGSTDITFVECGDPTGCACGNWQFAETICSHVKCKEPTCAKPFKPEGSCCDICGTLLKLSLGQDFKMDEYRHLLLNVSQKEYKGVSVATSKTEHGFVQIVLTDQENGKKAQVAAQHLLKVLTSEKEFRVTDVEIMEQSDINSVTGKQTGKSNDTLIVPLAVGLTVLALLIIGSLFLIFRRTKKIRSRSFPLVVMDDLELDEVDNTQNTGKENHELAMDNLLYECSANGTE